MPAEVEESSQMFLTGSFFSVWVEGKKHKRFLLINVKEMYGAHCNRNKSEIGFPNFMSKCLKDA